MLGNGDMTKFDPSKPLKSEVAQQQVYHDWDAACIDDKLTFSVTDSISRAGFNRLN